MGEVSLRQSTWAERLAAGLAASAGSNAERMLEQLASGLESEPATKENLP